MKYAVIFVYGFMALWGAVILYAWVYDLLKERKEPFLFDVGETVIRLPAFEFQAALIATSTTHWRYKITARHRNWLGRKMYSTEYPGVPHPVVFRERKLRKNDI